MTGIELVYREQSGGIWWWKGEERTKLRGHYEGDNGRMCVWGGVSEGAGETDSQVWEAGFQGGPNLPGCLSST